MENYISINFINLRTKFNLLQEDLATILNISKDRISAIENNKNKKHDINVLQVFCKYFEISLDDLINKDILSKIENEYYVNSSDDVENDDKSTIINLESTIRYQKQTIEFKDQLLEEKNKSIGVLMKTNDILEVLLNQNNTLEKLQIISIIDNELNNVVNKKED